MKKTVLLLLTMLCSCNFLLCYSHQIDVEKKECLKKAQTTADMNMCVYTAVDKWDKEINKYYNLLNKTLKKE